MAVVFLIGFLVIPYNIAFGEAMEIYQYKHSSGAHKVILIILRMLYVIFLVDIVVNFFSGLYENRTKTAILDPKIIAKYALINSFLS